MKVPCPTCKRSGKMEKVFPNGVHHVSAGFMCFGPDIIVDAKTGQRVGIPAAHIPGYIRHDVMPMEDCRSCAGTGWIDQQPDISATVSIT